MRVKRRRPAVGANAKAKAGVARSRELSGCARDTLHSPSVWDRRFWLFACGIILLGTCVRVFDFSLAPPAFRGLFITRPYYGLHSWLSAERAWSSRNHVKYGLGYTKGFRVLAVGDPPPAHPLRYVSHPPLETYITATGMLLLGQDEWAIQLFDIILCVPLLAVMLSILRRLFGAACALLSGVIFVLTPFWGYFAFDIVTSVSGLWALWRYLHLTGRLDRTARPRVRHYVELAVALFLTIQSSWVGVFYAFTIGMHYVVTSVLQRKVRASVLAVLVIAPLLSVALNFSGMLAGYRWNMAAEPDAAPVEFSFDRGGVLPPLVKTIEMDRSDTAWGLITSLYRWRASEGERSSFSWGPWLGTWLEYASTNFTPLILVLLAGYLIYFLGAHAVAGGRRFLDRGKTPRAKISRDFPCIWFFFWPGVLFLLTFKGLVWAHQFWQAPLALFAVVGASLAILSIWDTFAKINRGFGIFVVAALMLVLTVWCNQGLVDYRAVRWQSPRTIEMFKYLHSKIPPDKALLTFRDFVHQQSRGKTPTYWPEYAWCLDRDMIVANAWQENMIWAKSVSIDEAVERTLAEIQEQAKTGRFSFYFIPARERPGNDPGSYERQEEQLQKVLAGFGLGWDPTRNLALGEVRPPPPSVASLDPNELQRRLNDADHTDDELLYLEKRRCYREAVIARLKKEYRYEYFDNPADSRDGDFDFYAITPCYLFDLSLPAN